MILPDKFVGSTAIFQHTVVEWLREQQAHYGVKASLAKTKTAEKEFNLKRESYKFAADCIEKIEIGGSFPKPNKCPNCGEEML